MKKQGDNIHSVEQLQLLQQYYVLVTLVLGLPSVQLYLKRDNRFIPAIMLYISLLIIFTILYNAGNKTLFPDKTII